MRRYQVTVTEVSRICYDGQPDSSIWYSTQLEASDPDPNRHEPAEVGSCSSRSPLWLRHAEPCSRWRDYDATPCWGV